MKSKPLFYLILLTFLTSFIPVAHAQTFSVIHTFTAAEHTNPTTGVTIRGNALYGTLWGPSCGAVYQLTHSGSNWIFANIALLSYKSCSPYARVVFGPDGHLYGTANDIGTYYGGNIFKLTPQAGPCRDLRCLWNLNVVHQFGSGKDGKNPSYGDLIWDQQGNMYGTTQNGGKSGNGAVYQLTPSGSGYTESVLYSFTGGADGAYPNAGLVLDKNGKLLGTTVRGGSNDAGTVFELIYVPGVGWTEHVVYNFQNASDGEVPIGGLIFDSAGNLFGTSFDGGSGGGGTIFELSPSGNTWTYKLLYSFTGGRWGGPMATLTMDGAGNLYGTTFVGGLYNNGSVFKLANTQNGWLYTSLHDFTGGADGGYEVRSNVVIATDGTLYGTTAGGGDKGQGCFGSGCGVVWMIKP